MSGGRQIGRHVLTMDSAEWSTALDAAIFPVTSAPKSPETFSVDVAMWGLGDVSLFRHVSDAIEYRREVRHLRDESIEALLIPFSVNTMIRFKQDGIDRICEPGQFIIERSTSPYAFQQESRGEMWTLKIPVAAFRHNARRIETFVPYVFDATQGPGGLLLDLLRMVPRRLAGIDERSAAELGTVVIDMLVLAMQSDGRVLGGQHGSVRRAHLARIEHYIRRHLGERALDPNAIADANGVSLRYLHALFQDNGTSVSRWIREQRLDACDRDLRHHRRGETVAEIGYRWGFAEAAHFSRVFKARYGLSPRDRQSGLVS